MSVAQPAATSSALLLTPVAPLRFVHFSPEATPLAGLGVLRHRHGHHDDPDDLFNTGSNATAQAGRFGAPSLATQVHFYFICLFFILIPLSQSQEETFDLNAFPDDPDSPTSSLAANRGSQTQIAPPLSPTPMASGPTGNKSTADIVPFYMVQVDGKKKCQFCL